MSFNGVTGRVLLSLFQQSYKDFKGKFFKICCSKFDPTLLDEFPLYWVEKPGLKNQGVLRTWPTRSGGIRVLLQLGGGVYQTQVQPQGSQGLHWYPPFLPLFLLYVLLLTCVLCGFGLLCIVVFLCRHGT